jgi:hypothetical protein
MDELISDLDRKHKSALGSQRRADKHVKLSARGRILLPRGPDLLDGETTEAYMLQKAGEKR